MQLLCQSFQMAGEQDRRILKAAATSKRGKQGGAGTAATAAKDAKTFQAGVGGQADAASLLLEGLLLKVGSLVGGFDTCRWNALVVAGFGHETLCDILFCSGSSGNRAAHTAAHVAAAHVAVFPLWRRQIHHNSADHNVLLLLL